MSVNGSIPCSTSEVLSFSVRNVLAISLNVSLGQTEIKDEDFVTCLIQSDTEIVWLNVPVNEMSVVNVLNSLDHLINEHKNCLK